MRAILVFSFLLFTALTFAQRQFSKDSVMTFQAELNAEYADEIESPLLPKDRKTFKTLEFFAPNADFFIIAKLIRTPNEVPFEMMTSGPRRPMYVKYGEAVFSLDGKQCRLNIYQNVNLVKKKQFENNLFLPFTDLTSGVESYGGGRYIDLKILPCDTIVLDFNLSYNPYCAYNHNYSCPIPPEENNLKVKIVAGVKKFHE